MNRSGQQYPSEIAAGGPATPEGLPAAKTRRVGQDAVIKEIVADFGLEGVTKKQLIGNNEN